jgi:hypothetical protein
VNQPTGVNYGVRGDSASTSGRGVLGYATAATGLTYGLYGLADSNGGVGLLGHATSATGATIGLRGIVSSPGGVAGEFENRGGGQILSGRSGASLVEKFSVDGSGNVTASGNLTANGSVGIGTTTPVHRLDVMGSIGGISSGVTSAIVGTNTGTVNDGVDGISTNPTGATAGVYGESSGNAGFGVYGYAGSGTGTTYGVYGQAVSPNGIGVYGQGGEWAGYFMGPVFASGSANLGGLSLDGQSAQIVAMDRNTGGGGGNSLTLEAGSGAAGSTDQGGGDLVLTAGYGTGLGGGGNVRLQTAGANDASGTTDNTLVDRIISVGKAKPLTLNSPGFTSLMSIHLTGTHTAGGRIFYVIRATDGGSQVATEEGVIQYLATPNSITCTVDTSDKLHLGTVNSGCTPGFFNPGSQPGISIYDNVSFSSPAPLVVNEVYFTIENDSGASIRLEP